MSRIVVMDDEPDLVNLLVRRLRSAGFETNGFTNVGAGVRFIAENPPELILLDRMMPDLSGDEVQKMLSADPLLSDIPVIFLSAKAQAADKVEGLRLGVDDYLTKPFDSEELIVRIQNILKKKKAAQQKAWSDQLTGCLNRAAFDFYFAKMFKGAERYGRFFSILVADVDNFKRINDTLGHEAGDRALARLAATLKGTLRESDLVARYGGDEFVVLLPETGEEGALRSIERIQQAVGKLEPLGEQGADGTVIRMRISVGSATYCRETRTPAELFNAADQNMYAQKNRTRSE